MFGVHWSLKLNTIILKPQLKNSKSTSRKQYWTCNGFSSLCRISTSIWQVKWTNEPRFFFSSVLCIWRKQYASMAHLHVIAIVLFLYSFGCFTQISSVLVSQATIWCRVFPQKNNSFSTHIIFFFIINICTEIKIDF